MTDDRLHSILCLVWGSRTENAPNSFIKRELNFRFFTELQMYSNIYQIIVLGVYLYYTQYMKKYKHMNVEYNIHKTLFMFSPYAAQRWRSPIVAHCYRISCSSTAISKIKCTFSQNKHQESIKIKVLYFVK